MAHTAVIAGVGPRIGESAARKFAEEGCSVGLFARSEDYLTDLADDLTAETDGEVIAVPTDITDPAQVKTGFDQVREAFGSVDILLNSAYPTGDTEGGFGETGEGPLAVDRSAFEQSWRVWADGAFLCSEQAAADMLTEDGGTILFTASGLALRGGNPAHQPAGFAGRGLARSLAHQLWPEGIHIANVLIDGGVGTPDQQDWAEAPAEGWIHPDHVVDTYWHLVEQHPSAWTLELDLRAYGGPIRGAETFG